MDLHHSCLQNNETTCIQIKFVYLNYRKKERSYFLLVGLSKQKHILTAQVIFRKRFCYLNNNDNKAQLLNTL